MGGLALAAIAKRQSAKNKNKRVFADGGMVDEQSSDITLMPKVNPNGPRGALSQVSLGQGSLARQANTEFNPNEKGAMDGPEINKKAILDRGIENLQNRIKEQLEGIQQQNTSRKAELERMLGDDSEETRTRRAAGLFGLARDFTAPVDRGSGRAGFIRSMSTAGQNYALNKAEELKERGALKKELAGLDYDPRILQTMKMGHDIGAPSSNYGKQAADEGYISGTPEFAKRVKELSQQEFDLKKAKAAGTQIAGGSFDKKTGNFITNNGSVIKAKEVADDREKLQATKDLYERIGDITPATLKQSRSMIDYTGSEFRKTLGGYLDPKTKGAQLELQATGIQEVLNNLPKGAASDKDVALARSSFPGYSDPVELANWIKRTKLMIERKHQQLNDKYGSDAWYGERSVSEGVGNKPAGVKAKATKVYKGVTYYLHSDGVWHDEDEK